MDSWRKEESSMETVWRPARAMSSGSRFQRSMVVIISCACRAAHLPRILDDDRRRRRLPHPVLVLVLPAHIRPSHHPLRLRLLIVYPPSTAAPAAVPLHDALTSSSSPRLNSESASPSASAFAFCCCCCSASSSGMLLVFHILFVVVLSLVDGVCVLFLFGLATTSFWVD